MQSITAISFLSTQNDYGSVVRCCLVSLLGCLRTSHRSVGDGRTPATDATTLWARRHYNG
jgi:hypothetical protein